VSSLLISCLDGPCAGHTFTVPRCPRVVRCTLGADGKADILNLLEDEPEEGESVHWYRWDGQEAVRCHIFGSRRKGYMPSGWYSMVNLLAVELETFPAPREADCAYGCCEAGDEGLFSEAVAA
jgi:hypothetical protein